MKRHGLTTIIIGLVFSLVSIYPKTQVAQSLQNTKQVRKQQVLDQINEASSEQLVLETSLDKAMTLDEILRTLSSKQLTVEYLVHTSGEHTSWYVLSDGETLEAAARNFEQEHAAFLQDQIIEQSVQLVPSDLIGGSPGREQVQKSRERLAQDFSNQLSHLRSTGLSLTGFAAKGNRESLVALVAKLPVDKAKIRSINKSGETKPNQEKTNVKLAAATSRIPYPNEPWKFSPTSGVLSYDANSKYFKSSFIFTDISGFNSTHSAYEHNITISSPKGAYVKPGSGAWHSNLPDFYIDTTLLDKDASIFTIGSASATRIKTNNAYYVQIPVQVINENAGPSHGTIQPQLGSWAGVYDEGESPSEILERAFCNTAGGATLFFRGFPAFCVFADQTHTIRPYNAGSSSAQFFPFDHKISSSASWKAQAAKPTINPGSLSSPNSVKATISSTTVGATIRYTTNGADPSSSSPIYTAPLTFNSSVTLKARAFKSGLSTSDVTSVTYSIVRSPSITKADYMSSPVAGNQFIMRLQGLNFDPARIRVVVTGPGCSSFGACIVSNSVLRNSGSVTASLIDKVPLTLSAGSFQLQVQNGSSLRDPVSQGTAVIVAQPTMSNPAISNVAYLSTPVEGKQFIVRVDGRNFDTNVIRVIVTGPGCSKFGSCVVPNNVLKSSGSVTSSRLSNVPLKLDEGKYQLYVQNATSGTSRASSGYPINVNPPPLELTKVIPETTPKRGKQFISRIDGNAFDKDRIRVVVTGPGCPNFGMCVVPNNVIRNFGSVSKTRLSKVPMTLGTGTYKVQVQNGTSFRDSVSNAIQVKVN